MNNTIYQYIYIHAQVSLHVCSDYAMANLGMDVQGRYPGTTRDEKRRQRRRRGDVYGIRWGWVIVVALARG